MSRLAQERTNPLTLVPAVQVEEGVGILEQPETSVDGLKQRLKKLGLSHAAKKLDGAQRLAIAYAKYGVISQEKVDKFNEKLKKETLTEDKMARSYKRLLFTPLENYHKIPPQDVLVRLEAAMNDSLFDTFEIATIQWIKEVIDPILFGRIEDCPDRFFVAQWDDDVRIEDIVGA